MVIYNEKCIYLAILFSSYCYAQKVESTNKEAKNIYKKHLSIIDQYLDLFETKDTIVKIDDHIAKGFDSAITFLEKTTAIESDIFSSFDRLYEPSKENYKDWKAWYKLNRKELFLDSGEVKIKGKAIPVKKNPLKYYRNKLKLVKKSIKRKLFADPEYSDAIYFLRVHSGIENNNHQYELDVPSQKELLLFKIWLKENKNKLFWDIEHHAIGLRKSN